VRTLSTIVVCLVIGCSQTISEPMPAASSEPAVSPTRPPNGLYTDEEIRKLAKFDIDKVSGGDLGIFGLPCLDVVPKGESYPRSKVFMTLKIDDTRIRDCREEGINSVVFLTWQVSPSYDISCMTAINDGENEGLEMTDPRRKVYGIRLVKRSK
jgi:hypothetical protein